ncbi:MAG: uroporphyrinogen-III C-methyltransferase [Pseudomonadales bacterium]
MTKRNKKNTEAQKDVELQKQANQEPTDEKTQVSDAPAAAEDSTDSAQPNSGADSAATDEAKKAVPASTTDATQSNTTADEPKAASSKVAKLAFAVSLVALAVSGYIYNEARLSSASQSDTLASISQLEGNLDSALASANKTAQTMKSDVAATVADVNKKLATLQSSTADKEREIEALQARLTRSIQQVEASTQQRNSRKDWLLAEVEYLMRLANQRALMEKSPIGALALLKSADQILVQTDDVSLFSVRKALAADIAALEAVPAIDQEGIYLKLDAMSEQIDQLKLVPITDKKKLPGVLSEVAGDAVSEPGALAKAWDKATSKLEKLVVISHRSEAIEPLLSPAQQAGLLQNLHILFEQAQLSLLQQKPQAFARSLAKAQKIISTYFEPQDGTSQALLKGLKALEGTQISADMPSISGSLSSLKSHLAQASEIRAGAGAQ